QVRQGALDDKLVLRRRLRRPLDQYTKNLPPHVKAARLAEQVRAAKGLAPAYQRGGWIEYVITLAGPEPRQYQTSQLDYNFYIERQLAPIADAVLVFNDTSLAELDSSQLDLF
ncbi:MAG: DNA polymerase II, partial [Pseudomonadales bacterium]